jgi:hypothetical protein
MKNMQASTANLRMPIEQKGFFNKTQLKMEGGHTMMKFNLFALTFTVSVRRPASVQQRYEDRKRIETLRNKMLDKRFEYERHIR